jgi:hypothetical protein
VKGTLAPEWAARSRAMLDVVLLPRFGDLRLSAVRREPIKAWSDLTMAGVPQRTIMEILGHRDPRMAIRYQMRSCATLSRTSRIPCWSTGPTSISTSQYVADEVVVTWPVADARANSRCLTCHFALADAIQRRQARYEQAYTVVPSFRTGIHVGPVVAGEIRAVLVRADRGQCAYIVSALPML